MGQRENYKGNQNRFLKWMTMQIHVKICENTAEAAVRGRFIALNIYIRKEKGFKTENLSFHLKELEKMANETQSKREQKRTEINEIEKKTIAIQISGKIPARLIKGKKRKQNGQYQKSQAGYHYRFYRH